MNEIGERLKQLRKEYLKLTQTELADQIGVTGAAISRIEKGERMASMQILRSICRAFNVRQAWLETGEEPIFEPPTEADELAQLLKGASENPTKALLFRIIASLPDYLLVDLRREIRQIMRKLPPQPPDEE